MRTLIALAIAASLASAQDKGRRPEQGKGIDPGQDAADFKLKRLKDDPKEKDEFVELSSFKGKRTVVLIFGSYT